MILLHHLDSFTSADTFNSTQVFVSLSLTVGGELYWILGSGTKLFVTGKNKASFSFSCFLEQVENVFLMSLCCFSLYMLVFSSLVENSCSHAAIVT